MSPLQHSRAPDFAEAVVGYRAWDLAPGFKLGALAFATALWKPGVNKAECALTMPGGRGHFAPAPGCACGFNALHDPTDDRLTATANRVIGAIACWGEVQVHATGLRAEYACVIALAAPARAPARRLEELERVAANYAVPLVPRGRLRQEAVRHARPLPPQFLPRRRHTASVPRTATGAGQASQRSRRGRRPGSPAIPSFGGPAPGRLRAPTPVLPRTGVWLDGHVAVKLGKGGILSVGATRALGALLEPPCATITVAPGSAVSEGDALAVVRSTAGQTVIAAPCDGRVTEVNEALGSDPGAIHDDPAGAGWVARLTVEPRSLEDSPIAWDREGHEAYRGHVRAAGDDEALLAAISLGRHLAWSDIAGFGDLAVVLRLPGPTASLHPIPDAAAVRTLAEKLSEWATEVPRLLASFDQLGLAMRMVVKDRDHAELTVPADSSPVLTLEMSADTLHAFWSGELDMGRAIGDDVVVIADGDRGDALIASSLCQRLFARYRLHVEAEQSPRRRALRALDGRDAA